MRYVDRWEPDQNRALFPELGEATFPEPDIVANLDVDGLRMIENESQNFVIASHIIEHVADPLGLLDDVHRVTSGGGVALILLPDRRRTFDSRRESTSLDHLIDEHELAPTVVDDAHIIEFLDHTEPPEVVAALHADEAAMREAIERHRTRSIHAHCWHEEEFAAVVHHCILDRGHDWEFVDGCVAEEEGPDGHEFGYVLRRSMSGLDAEVLAERFRTTYEAWLAERRAVLDAVYATYAAATDPAAGGSDAVTAMALRLRAMGRRVRSATKATRSS